MKKRTYKRMQNRLYREIKRRMYAEQAAMFHVPINLCSQQKNIKTIKIRYMIPCYEIRDGYDEFVKREMVKNISVILYKDGYITFYKDESDISGPLTDCIIVEARLDVVEPTIGR